jgi:hypothetical protein
LLLLPSLLLLLLLLSPAPLRSCRCCLLLFAALPLRHVTVFSAIANEGVLVIILHQINGFTPVEATPCLRPHLLLLLLPLPPPSGTAPLLCCCFLYVYLYVWQLHAGWAVPVAARHFIQVNAAGVVPLLTTCTPGGTQEPTGACQGAYQESYEADDAMVLTPLLAIPPRHASLHLLGI